LAVATARAAFADRDATHPEEIKRLWHAFKKDGCSAARERLILHYMHLAGYVAGLARGGVPRSVQRDDLVSSGVVGLIEAVERFDLSRDVKFETYATSRIRGAMLDEMRALDWVPRSVRTKATALERAIEKLRSHLLRHPTPNELAFELGMDIEDLYRLLGTTARMQIILETAMGVAGPDGEYAGGLEAVPDTDPDQPGVSQQAQETRRALLEAVEALGDRERTMIWLYYFEGYTLSRIGKIWGVSESRVAQIHSKALRELRGAEVVVADGESLGWTMKAGRTNGSKSAEVGELEAIRIARRRDRRRQTAAAVRRSA
jgi:RNA polymerase sigma factor FliA